MESHQDYPDIIERWEITNERKNASPLLGFLPLFRSMTTDITEELEMELDVEFLVEFADRHVKMAAYMPHWEMLGDKTVRRLEHPDFIEWISKGLAKNAIILNELGDSIRSFNVTTFSKVELAATFRQAISALEKFLRYNQFVNTADFYHNRLTTRLLTILENCLRDSTQSSVNAAYSALTTPADPVWIQQEQEDALRILAALQMDSNAGSSQWEIANSHSSKFEQHAQTYFWIQYEQEGRIQNADDFQAAIMKMLNSGVDAIQELVLLRQRREASVEKFENIWKSVTLPKEHQQIFLSARQLVFWKLHLREIKVRFYCSLDALMGEIASRLRLDGTQVRHLTEAELTNWLENNYTPQHRLIDERIRYSVYRFSSGVVSVLVGTEAKAAFSIVSQDEPVDSLSILSGTCGQPGKSMGRVRHVLTVEDMASFKQGEILVAFMTDVGVVPAMRRAAAIVTDVGGVTCHAAIVAREFGIPCVIGTKIGTKVLKDGYLVEVEADLGSVKILEREPFPDEDNVKSFGGDEFQLLLKGFKRFPSPSDAKSEIVVFSGPAELDSLSIGGKAASLCNLSRLGYSVPPGFVIPSEAFLEFAHSTGIADKIRDQLVQIKDGSSLQEKSDTVRDLIINEKMPSAMAAQINENFMTISSTHVAVRSSAPMEDSKDASWAGQLETFLNTTETDLIGNVMRCWASRFSARALAYGLNFGAEANQLSTAVVVQKMVDSRISGTAFSVHPNDKTARTLIVESCVGLGELLVSGRETPASYVIERETLKVVEVTGQTDQKMALRRSKSGNGNRLVELSDQDRARGQLTAFEIEFLCRTVLHIEREDGHPVDVEWAIEGEQLYIVQSRPITR